MQHPAWKALRDVVPESARVASDPPASLGCVNACAANRTEEQGASYHNASCPPPNTPGRRRQGGASEGGAKRGAGALHPASSAPTHAPGCVCPSATGRNSARHGLQTPGVQFIYPTDAAAKLRILESAHALLVRRGWRPDTHRPGRAKGVSLTRALQGEAEHPIYHFRARQLLARMVEGRNLPAWEEHPAREADEVLALLERAAAQLGGAPYVTRETLKDTVADLRAQVARLAASPKRRAVPARAQRKGAK
jgi:hypothetical protein